uniref:Uncharacterized protein n=1 Tax=Sander lucioperca TaxID=283035 RepID=A0A8D0A861_SANLU
MANIGNTDNINLGCNSGNVGSNNAFTVQGRSEWVYSLLSGCHDSLMKSLFHMNLTGGVGPNAAVGNTSGIRGNNAGNIGSGSTFDIRGEIFLLLLILLLN